MPPDEQRNVIKVDRGKKIAPFADRGCGGVDSYDLDATLDGRGSKGAMHLYNKFHIENPSNMFIVEYCSRPDLATI